MYVLLAPDHFVPTRDGSEGAPGGGHHVATNGHAEVGPVQPAHA
jgi:hypothetical protein